MKQGKVLLLSMLLMVTMICVASPQVSSTSQSRLFELGADIQDTTVLSESINYQNNKASHWAVIVGISDYKAIGDLRFCDEDANDWYDYLVGLGYEHIIVLGDNTSSYNQYDGLATEYNVKESLLYVISNAGAKDTIAFISSGHGSGDSRGSSLLCMWDITAGEDGEDGYLWDYELASIMANARSENIFVFLDHCFAGGFGDDLMAMPNAEYLYVAVTCDIMGMGWDAGEYSNGLWTYFFLEYSLIEAFESDPNTEMEVAFDYAVDAYPYPRGAHYPQEYDGDIDTSFLLW